MSAIRKVGRATNIFASLYHYCPRQQITGTSAKADVSGEHGTGYARKPNKREYIKIKYYEVLKQSANEIINDNVYCDCGE